MGGIFSANVSVEDCDEFDLKRDEIVAEDNALVEKYQTDDGVTKYRCVSGVTTDDFTSISQGIKDAEKKLYVTKPVCSVNWVEKTLKGVDGSDLVEIVGDKTSGFRINWTRLGEERWTQLNERPLQCVEGTTKTEEGCVPVAKQSQVDALRQELRSMRAEIAAMCGPGTRMDSKVSMKESTSSCNDIVTKEQCESYAKELNISFVDASSNSIARPIHINGCSLNMWGDKVVYNAGSSLECSSDLKCFCPSTKRTCVPSESKSVCGDGTIEKNGKCVVDSETFENVEITEGVIRPTSTFVKSKGCCCEGRRGS